MAMWGGATVDIRMYMDAHTMHCVGMLAIARHATHATHPKPPNETKYEPSSRLHDALLRDAIVTQMP
eukprot:360339-Chlamydomonas_euryale.AAC.7